MQRDSRGTVLITGASQGIGAEFAKLFAKDNYDLVLVARNKDKLTQFARELQEKNEVFIKILIYDLSTPSSARKIFDDVDKEGIEIDILINNAGFATHGEFISTDYDEELGEIEVNITALTLLTKLFLPQMKKRKAGKILNVASTAAFLPGPFMAVYYASKAYVLSFSESLQEELKGTGITLTILAPGPTKTGFASRANVEKSRIFSHGLLNPTMVAKLGYDGLMRGEYIIFPGLKNKLASIVGRVFPHSFLGKIIGRLQR